MAFNLSEAERYKQALKRVKDFTGHRGNPAIQWLSDLQWECNNDPNLSRLVLPRKLGTRAVRKWYDQLSNIEKNQFPVLKARFLTQYVPSSFYSELEKFMQKRRMRLGESVSSYYEAIDEVKSKMGARCPVDSVICSYFRSGLDPKIRNRLPVDQCNDSFADLEQLLESARIIELDNLNAIRNVSTSLLKGIDNPMVQCDGYQSDWVSLIL